jgi:hypothetical protein
MVSSGERREISNARTGLDCDGTQSDMRIKMKVPGVFSIALPFFLPLWVFFRCKWIDIAYMVRTAT